MDYAPKNHRHQGNESNPISVQDLIDFLRTVTEDQTNIPFHKFIEQLKIYNDGTKKGLALWDEVGKEWIKLYGITQNVTISGTILHFTNGLLTSVT